MLGEIGSLNQMLERKLPSLESEGVCAVSMTLLTILVKVVKETTRVLELESEGRKDARPDRLKVR